MAKTQVKYCLPVVKAAKDQVIKTIKKHLDKFAYFEVWFDHIKDIDNQFVRQLQHLLGPRLIAKNPGAKISLLKNSAALVDLDIASIPREIPINLITSYHNYQETPSDKKLAGITKLMSAYQPKIYKIATKCNSAHDAVRLLQLLLHLKKQHLRCVVIGMGNIGKITRVAGALWGNEFTFAPLKKSEQTAKGQLTRDQYEKTFKLI